MNRFIMAHKKVETKKFLLISYLFFTIGLFPFILFFKDSITSELFSIVNISILLFVVFFSLGSSFFRNIGFKNLKVEIVEPILSSQLIFSIILGFLFFKNERNLIDSFMGVVIFITLLFLAFNVQNKKLILNFNKFHFYVILSAFFSSLWAVLVTYLLQYYHPVILTFFRCILITLILALFIRISFKDVSSNYKSYFLLSIFDIGSTIFLFYSFQHVGLITTMIIISLQPLIAQWFSSIFLKERLHIRNILATLIIIFCMIISIYF